MQSPDKLYVVIDTNVIVSSFFSRDGKSNPSVIIQSIFRNKLVPIINDDIIDEYRDVLYRSKFQFSSQLIENLITTIIKLGVKIESREQYDEYFPDPKDIVFYEVRMAVDDSYLVTGNTKHYPTKPFIVTPTQMVEILKEKGLISEL